MAFTKLYGHPSSSTSTNGWEWGNASFVSEKANKNEGSALSGRFERMKYV
jgi:hypothetical protein